MRIVRDKPFPLLDRVRKQFTIDESCTVFAYGEDLYAPADIELPPDLLIHEAIHAVQQTSGKDEWWERYLTDEAFRLAQEVQAYRAQYQWVCMSLKDRNARSRFLTRIAKDLSSPTYGSICSFSDAYRLIKN